MRQNPFASIDAVPDAGDRLETLRAELGLALDECWIDRAVRTAAVRLHLPARQILAVAGAVARPVYLVETGELLVHRPRGRTRPGGPRAAVRVLSSGDLLCWGFGGAYEFEVSALADCILLRIDRRWLQRQAAFDPVLAQLLRQMHTTELEWLLRTTSSVDGPASCPQPAQFTAVGASRQG